MGGATGGRRGGVRETPAGVSALERPGRAGGKVPRAAAWRGTGRAGPQSAGRFPCGEAARVSRLRRCSRTPGRARSKSRTSSTSRGRRRGSASARYRSRREGAGKASGERSSGGTGPTGTHRARRHSAGGQAGAGCAAALHPNSPQAPGAAAPGACVGSGAPPIRAGATTKPGWTVSRAAARTRVRPAPP